jgi:hypothetical protein
MKPGVTLQEARADVAAITQRINSDHPTPGFELRSVVISLRDTTWKVSCKPFVINVGFERKIL